MQSQDIIENPAFNKKRSQHLDTLNITVEEYEHKVTGALHYHLASENPENVFLVALRTVPMDSTGVAHILEHTALCGSKKFPIRDPFFMMIRRSMNTFMNAFTSSDWTAYPFASQNQKDFGNLLEVYLDAVFFASLNEMDFAQEGHRLEFSEPTNPDSPLEYKGVVYNEMKGAMSSSNSLVWQLLCKHLFPSTTYHYNSGGDPADIPNLSYQQLQDFYRTHYHPSNAVFMTFGDIPAAQHQEKFERLALKDFKKLDVHIAVEDEQRYQAPVYAEERYPLDEDDIENKTHIVLAWLLGNSTNLEELYKAQLLSSVLLDNSASPLQQALETSTLGRSPSPLCGLEDSQREMSFICGLEACTEGNTAAIEKLILATLQEVADKGVAQDKVEAALHALELHQREISGDSYPYGLQLILASLSTATHRGDPIKLLDIDPVLNQLKDEIKNPDFIPDLIRKLLLDNSHRVILTVKPDATLSSKQAQEEAEKLATIKAKLSDTEKQAIIERAKKLEARQNQIDDASILPKVELSDVPPDIKWPDSSDANITANGKNFPTRFYPQGTNGLSYQQVVITLPKLPEHLTTILPYYVSCIPELGIAESSYLDIQSLQASISGGVHAHTSMRSKIDNEQALDAYLVISSKALYPNQASLSQLLFDTLHACRFDEHQRIKEIMEQICSHKEQSITSQGHGLAMGLAGSKMSPLAAFNYQSSGLEGIKSLKELCKSFDDKAQLKTFADKFNELHQLILQGNKQFLLIAEESEQKNLLSVLETNWNKPVSNITSTDSAFELPEIRESVREAWITSTQVNFCAKAYPTVPTAHEDCPALTVLGGFLRNGYLHRTIREQGGAYGGGANQDSGSASFRFFSYRDPRLSETLDDFSQSIQWLLNNEHEDSQLEEAILGVISSLDKPSSPSGTAKQAYYNELFGRTKAQRAQFRQNVLNVTIDKLKQVTEQYLRPELASVGIISNKTCQAELEKLGLEIKYL
ncbi:insulinase family protein [Gammaproteobacteria bacterium]|nr:insulinase family protein [Gammaproteobacteria bacterium]